MKPPLAFARADAFELTEFLRAADLTTSGVGEPDVQLWVDLDPDGRIVGSTGFELHGEDVLLRSVAVDPSLRGTGRGSELARFALETAASLGATRAWLFSRRSGPFWRSLGFETAEIAGLASALAETHQVRAFAASGQLAYESAWTRALGAPAA
jgi:N-acetylglutamate synthase-like GNAT family acetyltransferase